MTTTRTRINRRSSAITEEMIAAFRTIRREYSGIESPSDAFIDAFTRLHMLLGLWPCHPSPALVHSPEPEGANEFITQCYADSWEIRQRIEEAIADARFRSRTKPSPAREHKSI
jgi:hypothetical protein